MKTYNYAGREIIFLPVGNDEASSKDFIETIRQIFVPSQRTEGDGEEANSTQENEASVSKANESSVASRPVYVPVSSSEDTDEWCESFIARLKRLPEKVDFIFRTSGSTSSGGHLVGHTRVALRQSALVGSQVLGRSGRWVASLPMHHIGGFLPILRSILEGHEPLIIDRSGGFSPVIFASQVLAETKEPSSLPLYVSLVPTQLKKGWDFAPFREALTRFNAVLIGGGPMSKGFMDEVVKAGVPLVTSYGMTETCGGTAYNSVALPACEFIIQPLVNTQIEAVTTGALSILGESCQPLKQGRILQRCPWVMVEYLDTQTESFTYDERGLKILPTNDLGRLVDGRIEVLGRIDDVVVTGGVNVSAGEVLLRALDDPKIRERFTHLWFGPKTDSQWGQVLVAVAVYEGHTGFYSKDQAAQPVGSEVETARNTTSDDENGAAIAKEQLEFLRSQLACYLPQTHLPRTLLLVKEFPWLSSGKADRKALYKLLKNNG